MKLVVDEPESAGLALALVDRGPYAVNVVGEIETRRACRRADPRPPTATVDAALRPVTTIVLDDEIAAIAAELDPAPLRTLDAIHLATALSLGDDLDALVTYDVRLAEAAEAAGVSVLAPR